VEVLECFPLGLWSPMQGKLVSAHTARERDEAAILASLRSVVGGSKVCVLSTLNSFFRVLTAPSA
jgi:hypothetical protein